MRIGQSARDAIDGLANVLTVDRLRRNKGGETIH